MLHRAVANNEAPAVLSGLHNELKCYIAEISAPSECGLILARQTSSDVDRHRQMSIRCHTPSFPIWHSISLQPQHHKHMSRGFFQFEGTCVPENATGQVPTLCSIYFIEWTSSSLFGMNRRMIDSSLPTWETYTNCCQNLMLCCLVCIIFWTAVNSFIETSSNIS